MRCSASRVSVQVRDAAFPSTTSSGISVDGDADDVLAPAQLVDREIELLRCADQLELEDAVGLVLESPSRVDVYAEPAHDVFDGIESTIAVNPYRRIHLAAARQQAPLDRPQSDEDEYDEHRGAETLDICTGAD